MRTPHIPRSGLPRGEPAASDQNVAIVKITITDMPVLDHHAVRQHHVQQIDRRLIRSLHSMRKPLVDRHQAKLRRKASGYDRKHRSRVPQRLAFSEFLRTRRIARDHGDIAHDGIDDAGRKNRKRAHATVVPRRIRPVRYYCLSQPPVAKR